MNCWRVNNLVAPFLDGELPDAEADAVTSHLEECPACAELVESVDNLPPFPSLELEPELERDLFASFDACLAERIADSFIGEEEELPLAANGWSGALRRPVRVPIALVAAYLGVVVLLGGGIVLNHGNVQDLEVALQQRDDLLDTLRVRLQNDGPAPAPLLAADSAEPDIVFLPAGLSSTGLAPAASLRPGGATYGVAVPASYRVTESPRVIH